MYLAVHMYACLLASVCVRMWEGYIYIYIYKV